MELHKIEDLMQEYGDALTDSHVLVLESARGVGAALYKAANGHIAIQMEEGYNYSLEEHYMAKWRVVNPQLVSPLVFFVMCQEKQRKKKILV